MYGVVYGIRPGGWFFILPYPLWDDTVKCFVSIVVDRGEF